MRNKRIIFTVMGILILAPFALAQIPTPLKDVKVSSDVTLDKITGLYTYSYAVFNPPTNDGKISHFEIDITKSLDGQELNSTGLIIKRGMKARGGMLIRSFEEEIARKLMKKSVIPVGAQPPLGQPFPGWTAAIAVMGTAMWGGSEQNVISPNQAIGGFVLTSYGLPGLREFSVESDFIVSEDELGADVSWEALDTFYKALAYKGKTIGPTAPPADFKPIEFLNYIINMKHEAFSLGWIKNKGIENSLDVKLDNAKKKLEQGNNIATKNILNAFINEVEAQGCAVYENCPSGKHLTPEAYGLLKYNVQYLLNKL